MLIEELYEYLTDWHTLDEILNYLNYEKKDGRMLRRLFTRYNEDLIDGLYLAHSKHGYKLTNDQEEIKTSAYDDLKRLRKLAKRFKKAMYKVTNQNNINIYEYIDN